MKKLGNLNLNPKKVMNTEEMINIKGGTEELYYCTWKMECTDWLDGWGYASSCQQAMERVYYQQYMAYNIVCNGPGGGCGPLAPCS